MTKHWTESEDEAARCASLDTRRSFIVQAPAGSGKTELLIQRFLALLATVDEPGQVVAITFTRKAAGEMVDRILRAVHDAKGSPPKEPHQRRTWELGRAVLNRDRERDWSLLERPGQLRVQTIDAFCAAIVRQLPVTAGVGSSPQVIEDPTPYLREAARRVMYRLNHGDDLFPSLSNLLLHLDNDTEKVQRLMVAMLRARDQWLRHMPANGDMNRHREALEHSLRQFLEHHLSLLHEAFPATCRADFANLIRFVAQNFERFDLNETALTYVDAPKEEEEEEGFAEDSEQSDEDDTALASAEEPEDEEEGEGSAEDGEQADGDDTALADAEWPEEEEEESTPSITFVKPADLAGFPEPSLEYLLVWKFAAEVLLTKDGKFRKRFGASRGVSSPTSARKAKKQTVFEQMKGVATDLLDSLSQVPRLAELLNQVRLLPHGCYSSEQWKILKALLRVLPALNEALVQVFAEEGVLDFIEVAARARRALESPKATGLLEGIRHILVDEFQDTSFTQFDLLGLLTRTWASHGGQRTSRCAASNAKPTRTGASTDVPRTIFAVGDPMQSIYRFREAEVGLFLSTVSKKRLSGVPLAQALRLTRNFRSCENLIDWFDEIFSAIMPEAGQDDPVTGAVSFSPSVCGSGSQGGTVEVHPVFASSAREAGPLEAKMVADVVEKILERHACAQKEDGRKRTTAILVRTRSHVPHIVRELRQRQIKYMAVEIDPLSERPAVLDLWALTRALVHPADRIAWLSILHAPWCGLTLRDLYALAGDDHGKASQTTVWEAINDSAPVARLSDDGRARLERIRPVLASAIAAAGRCSGLRDLVESTWLGLGAPACGLTQTQLEEAREYFDLLEQHEEAGDLPDFEAFEEAMSNLYAPPAADADESLQIMTIHQAKGLEFDSVILPGMGRGVRSGGNQLLRWAEVEGPDGEERLLMLAPIDAAGEEPSEIGEWLKKLAKQKDDYESLRHLYVACTRAREELHLIGHAGWKLDAKTNSPVLKKPWHNSFLRHLWPEVAAIYEEHFAPLKKQLVQATEAVFGEEEPEEVAAAEVEETYERVPTLLTRVSAAWVIPDIPDTPLGAKGLDLGASPSAAAGDEGEEEVFLRHASPEMKHAGTVVHAFLQRIGNDGIEQWRSPRVRAARPEIDAALRRLGVVDPQKRSAAADRVIAALEATLKHPEARHFFDPENTEVHNEWPITGMVGGRVVNGIIDRTFVDRDGIRWIVDYKTSAHEGSGRDEFLRRKTDLYRRQLDDYAALLAALHGCDVSSIRRALFFPLLGEIVQWQG